MKSNYLLVKGSVNIDDDLDYDYLKIWTADDWEEHLSAAKEYFTEWEKRDESDLMMDDELKWYGIYHDFEYYEVEAGKPMAFSRWMKAWSIFI